MNTKNEMPSAFKKALEGAGDIIVDRATLDEMKHWLLDAWEDERDNFQPILDDKILRWVYKGRTVRCDEPHQDSLFLIKKKW